MRIISGSAKGIALKAVPGTGTRPTTDKVKEAIFSIIGPYFDGGRVLDLFAGTGGLGIEAISRGMDGGVFIDADPKALAVIRRNLEAARFADRAEVYRNDALRALKPLAKRGAAFDLVFLDPPYRMKIIPELLSKLQEYALLSEGATVVTEQDANDPVPDRCGALVNVRRAEYGDTAIAVFRHAPERASADGPALTARGKVDNGHAQSGEGI
ncbi:16S rRNA (guanine(966)-N(2))-methyltransferase RsmD [Paenibacillus thermoaerophilus]|uniref:16S rRNA (Guanine(966)-N(2))-methyltransferase RsmD n=1 Tax=Paenibacillus thermoaerophilus TaxID=1215385 RepID=A0ABW2V0M1_9BACL|nr:16S rRNA (guanine(966)-N(2))-methyltransferase RsmD [Paenibacillus thermoaerophilus]TMV19170.1 16S rRNA (guanine(966)-N(2))-methyltransferase RsmD [Paenibacillus thermoaerophilus]